jgi:hypothetical protein
VRRRESIFGHRITTSDFVVLRAFPRNALAVEQSDELMSLEVCDVESLELLSTTIVEDHLGRFARNLLELRVLERVLKVPVDEVLHLRELVQPSSSTGLDFAPCDGLVLGALDGLVDDLVFLRRGQHRERRRRRDQQPQPRQRGPHGGRRPTARSDAAAQVVV